MASIRRSARRRGDRRAALAGTGAARDHGFDPAAPSSRTGHAARFVHRIASPHPAKFLMTIQILRNIPRIRRNGTRRDRQRGKPPESAGTVASPRAANGRAEGPPRRAPLHPQRGCSAEIRFAIERALVGAPHRRRYAGTGAAGQKNPERQHVGRGGIDAGRVLLTNVGAPFGKQRGTAATIRCFLDFTDAAVKATVTTLAKHARETGIAETDSPFAGMIRSAPDIARRRSAPAPRRARAELHGRSVRTNATGQ